MTHVEESGNGNGGIQAAESAPKVIVGIDGSEAAGHALRWVAHKDAVFGAITPVATYQLPVNPDLMTRPATATDVARYREAARKRLTHTVTAEAPTLLDRAKVIDAHPGTGLVEAAADADLLVVGTRGHSALATALLGSVSAHCVNHSSVPVVLIPPEWPASRPISTVVVGVDGSANADRALQWVVDAVAPHLGAEGRIVAVGAFSTRAYAEAGYDPPLDDLESRTAETVNRAVAKATGASYDGPEIEVRVESRDPRVALPRITEAEGDLLVVGARGVSGLGHLLIGSVASALVHHPNVATVVIPAEPETDPVAE